MPTQDTNTASHQLKNFYSKHPWKWRFLLTVAVFFLLLILARAALSPVIIYSANNWLQQQGIDSSIENINIGLFSGTVSLIEAKGHRDNKPVFNIGLIELHWQWAPLSNKIFVIDKISFDKISINIEKYADKTIVSGINLPLHTGASEKEKSDLDSPEQHWSTSLSSILVNKLNVCYLKYASLHENASDNSKQIDYCVTLQEASWSGAINLDTSLQANGDLTVLQTLIHNRLIDRNLATLKSLALTKLSIDDFSHITLDKFYADSFTALQRSEKDKDSTVSFNNLTIDSVSYTDSNINIDTINLDGVSSHFSKNKKEQWEHNKWLIQNNEATTDNAAGSGAENKKSFLLSLNKLNINTESENLFTDNSTTPKTVAGLKKFTFDLSKLNTEKPNADSLFKLFAKTTRHSTINLEGTFRPFAKKVSLKADGTLKGFDLRATSPAAKKAIGHIIKSGQLDADLTLRADDGVLDSNVALSLYHFNLKAMSEKDSNKLDDLFGMPINQSLKLLRDKDDSIHLNIPITGDVNKPNFEPMDAIIKATTKATTLTLITFYSPYGLIYAGGNVLFDLATALDFSPLGFEAGSSDLTVDHKEKLNKLAKLLTEKPQVRLTLCGVTNTHDLYSLSPDMQKVKKDITLSTSQRTLLDKLAKERQVKSKNYLIEEMKIEHTRLILCTPEFNSDKDAFSGVEINI